MQSMLKLDPSFLPSDEQARAIATVLSGRNLFLTGCAGTGKSATLMSVRLKLAEMYPGGGRVAVVAMTGLAASMVGGITLHSLLKLRLIETFQDLERMVNDPMVLSQLLELRTIILDEAGMMSAELLQALDCYLTYARKEVAKKEADLKKLKKEDKEAFLEQFDRPFGGLQIILSGDFFQLAPIEKKAPVFQYGGFTLVELTKVYRQEEAAFVDLLNAVRCGGETAAGEAKRQLLAQCAVALDEGDGIKPTLLYSKNADVGRKNEEELQKLPASVVTLKSVEKVRVTFEPPLSVYQPLRQKGTLGASAWEGLMAALEDGGPDHRATLSKHLSANSAALQQAMEQWSAWRQHALDHLDAVASGAGGLFRDCQAADDVLLKVGAQVMLVWNVDTEQGLVNGSRGVIESFEPADADDIFKAVARSGSMAEVDCGDQLREWFDRNNKVPVVRFANGSVTPVLPVAFTSNVPGYGACIRVQVPLKLAWAITVHKSQGMTLDKVVVNLRDFFGHGMLYTALSRSRGVKGLQITGDSYRRMDVRVTRWWEAHRAGRLYINPDAHPDGKQGTPWCWKDAQQLCSKPQNAPARLWWELGPERYHEATRREREQQEAEVLAAEAQLRALAAEATAELAGSGPVVDVELAAEPTAAAGAAAVPAISVPVVDVELAAEPTAVAEGAAVSAISGPVARVELAPEAEALGAGGLLLPRGSVAAATPVLDARTGAVAATAPVAVAAGAAAPSAASTTAGRAAPGADASLRRQRLRQQRQLLAEVESDLQLLFTRRGAVRKDELAGPLRRLAELQAEMLALEEDEAGC
ncbi:hypothetical protein HXX76_011923 [Chlamydomonas incerta]|uniref:ATP-dependent DNA helicase n=1 Tax=Chlamydomonas incerta TaxID=51695 RepID=A0A835SLT3_CHLIN|nr:hypothetical protein HXX76_011923 [Chlamydomonas incerta]|eukprot:KAG2427936.1 hypothetical protein HXX76_011923 [Chlamydomonas incerta]